ncbi:MAG: peptidylprolyl isomerase [Candidatus Omnitrophica bacterium]|nr:peptidylprolyl isomerase [Candidatus Omnitrophota bacterium]
MRRFCYILICGLILFASRTACFAAGKESVPDKGKDAPARKGREVTAEFTVSVDGKVIDSSKKRGPLKYREGSGQVIPGLEKRLKLLHAGDTRTFDIPPAEAYGAVNPKRIREFKRVILPKTVIPKPDTYIQVKVTGGKLLPARIVQVKKDTVVLDFNHPLAGKTLHYQVKILSAK